MWIVKNNLRATLSLRGLGVTIAPGAEFDLDALGRDTAEHSPQVAVAFEENYLTNVHKAAREAAPAAPAPATVVQHADLSGLVTSADFEKFKNQFLNELRSQLPALQKLDKLEQLQTGAGMGDIKGELASLRDSIAADLKEATDDLKKIAHDKIASEKRRILNDTSLSEAEMKVRLAFLEEKEKELEKNFDTVGRQVQVEDGDVMDKADLLAGADGDL